MLRDDLAAGVGERRRRFLGARDQPVDGDMVAPVMRSRATWATTAGGRCRTISSSIIRFEDGMISPRRKGIWSSNLL